MRSNNRLPILAIDRCLARKELSFQLLNRFHLHYFCYLDKDVNGEDGKADDDENNLGTITFAEGSDWIGHWGGGLVVTMVT